MAIRISDIRTPVDVPEKDLLSRVLSIIGVDAAEVTQFSVVRRGWDARQKGRVRKVYTVEFALRDAALEVKVCGGVAAARRSEPPPDPFPARAVRTPDLRPVVVGAGPAGMFAALTLARFGAPPILVERGRRVEERAADVARFWKSGSLDPESNAQFGEGGAGTFSDGKLTTRIGDPLVEHVVGVFEEYSGIPGLAKEAKPHVGTDRLRSFCLRVRAELASLGAHVRFGAKVEGILAEGGTVRGVRLSTGEEIPCSHLVLAVGHSARDTIRMLVGSGVKASQKPFAVGFRVEHPQALIDRIQYGRMAGHPALPPADYRLATRVPSGRGVYSFCMCPGGEVMAASSGPGELPVNGMSSRARASGFANSGIVATVGADDFGADDLLAGVRFQEEIERRAWEKGGGGYGIPAANLVAFLHGEKRPPAPGKTLCPRVAEADLRGILPPRVEEDLKSGLITIGRPLRGFLSGEGTLYAVESRTSSPLRFERANFESLSHEGLYPVGEGAGQAGGIVSSAVDGIRGALRVLEKLSA